MHIRGLMRFMLSSKLGTCAINTRTQQ